MKRYASFVLFIALLPGLGNAYEDHGIGPAAGEVRSSVASPWETGSWLIGTAIGVFHMAPGAAVWEYRSDGLPRTTVTSIAAVTAEPGLLFAGLYGYPAGYGVYRSTDTGESWEPRNSGLGNLEIKAIASDPSSSTILYAATEDGVYRTTNAGDSWHLSGLSGRSVRDVVIDPGDGARAWASVAWEGIYRTVDSGATWNLASEGIGGAKLFYDLKAGALGDTLYAVGWDAYRSIDGGDTWTEMGVGYLPPSGMFPEAAIQHDDAGAILVAYFGGEIYRSADAGESWIEVGPASEDMIEYQTVSVSPQVSGQVLIGAIGGEVFLSGTTGDTWASSTGGISSAHMLSIDVRGSRWLAGTRRGVFVSEDWGRTWNKSDFIYDIGAEINSIAIAPGDGRTVFCGNTNGFFKGDVYRSTDGGWRWNLIKQGNGPVRAVVVDPSDPQRVYAGYSCDVVPGGVYRSTTGGTAWIEESLGQVCVYALQIDPSDPAVLLAGTSNGVFRSADYGDTWSPRGPAGVIVVAFSPDASQTGRFYAATYGARAYQSVDGGLSWVPFGGAELPTYLYAIEGRDSHAGVLAGSQTSGIWRYDAGIWVRLDNEDQPPVGDIRALLALPESGRFLAGTHGAGIWEYLSDPASTADLQDRGNMTVSSSPSRGPFTVRFDIGRPGAFRIDLFDVEGRRVRHQEREWAESGLQAWRWDGRDERGIRVATGIYIVSIRSDRSLQTAKICVLP